MSNEEKIEKLIKEYLAETTRRVKETIAQNKGREIVGDVINRPDDIEIGIDKIGEQVLENLLKKYALNVMVFSEPEDREIVSGDKVDFYGSIDPFDGSVIFLRGFEHNWYSALSFFDKKSNPVACGIVDIINERFYISDKKMAFSFDPKTKKKKQVFPSGRKKLTDPLIIASYLMSPNYSVKFFDVFRNFLKSAHSKMLIYPQGGSFIYAYLAAGLVDAYIMFDEPRSEIDSGFGMAKVTGCEIVGVNPDGTYENYKFLPGKQHGKINFFIATNSPELRNALIKYYLIEKQRICKS